MGLNLEYQDGQTPIDEDEKEGLIIKTITTQGELDEFEQRNIEEALKWVIKKRFKVDEILTEQFIRKLHKQMFGKVWKWAGEFRKSNKNIGVEWPTIPVGLRQLLGDTQYWIANETYSPDEITIRFKHRLVNIHCFPNGNGRHSRLMADIVIKCLFNAKIFTWSNSNMVKPSETRTRYITAIREGDKGNIQPLIDFARS